MKRPRSFTLVEVLISVSIFSVIILALYSVFRTAVMSYTRIGSAFDLYQAARASFSRMELDLKNCFIFSGDDSRFAGTGDDLKFFSVIDLYGGGSANPGVCRIEYGMKGDILERTVYPGIEALKDDSEVPAQGLAYNVRALSFQYAYLTGSSDSPFEWQESWPKESGEQIKALPAAVKITLSLVEKDSKGKDAGAVEFSKVIALPSLVRAAGASTGEGSE